MRLWRVCDADEEARSAVTYGAEEVVVLQARLWPAVVAPWALKFG